MLLTSESLKRIVAILATASIATIRLSDSDVTIDNLHWQYFHEQK